MYNPIIGRWMEEDPIDFKAGDANLSRDVGNNPTNDTDPSGLIDLGGGVFDPGMREWNKAGKILQGDPVETAWNPSETIGGMLAGELLHSLLRE
jgi:hypothetical protein